jgi:metal-dependent amidase/aminoacylase/carboxypeptidase family protein
MAENGLSYDGAWAIHVNSRLDSGMMGICEGGVYAAGLFFTIELIKKEESKVLPSSCAAALIRQLDAARNLSVSPFESLTLAVCKVNVSKNSLSIRGTCRFHDRESGGMAMYERIQQIAEGTALALGYDIGVVKVSTPATPVINNPACCHLAKKALSIAIGNDHVCEGNRSMGSESFRLFTSRFPSVLASLGVKNKEKGMTAEIHTPEFELDEDALPYGVASTVAYALSFLANEEEFSL